MEGLFSWNGWFYGFTERNHKQHYYKSKNVRFDDSCGGTKECDEKEYHENAVKYFEIMK